MKLLPILYVLCLFVSSFNLAFIYERAKKERVYGAFFIFLLDLGAWLIFSFLPILPLAKGLEEFFFRASGIAWISITFWYLNFVYELHQKKRDFVFKFCAVITLVGVVVFVSTGMGIPDLVRSSWVVTFSITTNFLYFVFIMLFTGMVALYWLVREFRSISERVARRSFLLIIITSLSCLVLATIIDVVIPFIFDAPTFPRLGVCATVLISSAVVWALLRHTFLSYQAKEIEQGFFKDVRDGVAIVDKDNVVVRLNQAAKELFNIGFEDGDLVMVTDLFPSYDTYKSTRYFEIDLGVDFEHRYLSVLGSTISYHGIEYGKIFWIRDLTDQKNANQVLSRTRKDLEDEIAKRTEQIKLAKNRETIGTLAGGIAHDFNNLLAAITGFSVAARDDLPKDHLVRKDLDEILIASGKAKNIVRQLLLLSSKEEPCRKVLGISAVVEETLSLMEASVSPNVQIIREMPDKEVYIMGDAGELHHALMNLCVNAAEAIGEKAGFITVKVKAQALPTDLGATQKLLDPDGSVVISVSDTGCGIDGKDMPHLFEPFFQSESRRKQSGTGLGLTTALSIVQAHNGSITVKSQKGSGTGFSIRLPIIDMPVTEDEPGELTSIMGNEHILLVDDETQVLRMEKRLLAALGYRITTYDDPKEALVAFQRTPSVFDLVITDYAMPGINGLQLATELFKERKNIPILLISGNITEVNIMAAKELGIRSFLEKPVSKKDLAGKIRRILDASSNDRQSFPLVFDPNMGNPQL